METYGEVYNVAMQALPLRKEFLREDPDSTQPYVGFLEENRPGKVLTAAPFFIAQGSVDPIVRPSVTRAFAVHLCSRGEIVRFLVLEEMWDTWAPGRKRRGRSCRGYGRGLSPAIQHRMIVRGCSRGRRSWVIGVVDGWGLVDDEGVHGDREWSTTLQSTNSHRCGALVVD